MTFIARAVTGVEIWNDTVSFHVAEWLRSNKPDITELYKLEQVIGTYVCSQKHNYIPYSTFTINKIQLHVSAINVGHPQVLHEASYDKLT